MDRLLIIGFGGHSKVINYCVKLSYPDIAIYTVDDEVKVSDDIIYLGKINSQNFDKYKELGGTFYVCGIGDNDRRKVFSQLADKNGLEACIIIHPNANIAPSVKIGKGSVILTNAVIHPDSVIGKHSIINTGAQLDHDCMVGDYCLIAPGVIFGGGVSVGNGTLIGIGAVVLPYTSIGSWTTIGGNSTVVRNIGDNVQAIGSPAVITRGD